MFNRNRKFTLELSEIGNTPINFFFGEDLQKCWFSSTVIEPAWYFISFEVHGVLGQIKILPTT